MNSNYSSYSYTSMNKSIVETDTSTAEESGWTAYFEDFMVAQQQDHHHHHHHHLHHHHHDYYNQDHHHHQQLQQQLDPPELSDAASHVVWSNIAKTPAPKFSKNLNLFKKTSRRTKEIIFDDSLEDTASSPVNSPKVGSQHMGFDQIKVDDIMENSLEKEGGFNDHLQPQKKEDQSRLIRFGENNNGGTDLRKRGLCLVPLSMFVKYI